MITFRPHHFMCTLSFKGLGYSRDFVKNYHDLKKVLVANEETQIKVTFKDDDICSKCPHLMQADQCVFQEKITGLDQRHIEALSLIDNEVLTWKQAKERIKTHITIEKFHKMCEGCEWKSLGVCEEALFKLTANT